MRRERDEFSSGPPHRTSNGVSVDRALRRRELLLWPGGSGDDPLDHLPMHVGQPEVASGVVESQLLVVEAKEMKNRGLKVVDVHGL